MALLVTVPPSRPHPGTLLAWLNLALGWVLVLGAESRTSAASFVVVREIMPVQVWGVLFLIGGLVCAVAHRLSRFGAVAVASGAGIYAFWATSLWLAVLRDDSAALTGAVVYTWLMLVHVLTGLRLARRVT
jgi:hypothetical protein